jgi:hypothetical protein
MLAEDVTPQDQAAIAADMARAVAEYRGPVRRLPTIIDVRCVCGHRKRVALSPGKVRPRFRCSRCGAIA